MKSRRLNSFGCPKVRGFTLVEMLVVLAILSLLAALLFTVFSRVREKGRSATCQSNQRQIYLALQSYIQDHDSRLPNLSEWREDVKPYIKNPDIFLCPTVSKHNEYYPEVDYDVYPRRFNDYEILNTGKRLLTGTSEANITNTSQWILLTDVGSGDEPSDVITLKYPTDCAQKLWKKKFLGRSFPVLHNRGGNYLFADGHTKWMLPQQGIESDCAAGPFLSQK